MSDPAQPASAHPAAEPPLAPDAEPYRVDVPLRWSDMDAYGHVNNVQFLRLLEDARVVAIREWFLQRFNKLRETVFRDPASFFRHYAALTDAEALARANTIWDTINGINLRDNIAPTRERADLILEKGADHTFQRIMLRLA